MSKKLFRIAQAIYYGKLPAIEIYVVLPMGIVFGKLTSREEIIGDIQKNVSFTKKTPVEQAIESFSYQFTYKDIGDDDSDVTNDEIVTLFNATLHMRDFIVETQLIHISANHVYAWGPGTRPE